MPMPDPGSITPVKGADLTPLTQIMGLANAGQQLQLNQLNLQQKSQTLPFDIAKQQAESEQQTIPLEERKAVAPILQNIKAYMTPDGMIDLNKFAPDVMAAAPTTGASYLSNVITAQKQGTDAKQAVLNLNSDMRGKVANAAAAWGGLPAKQVSQNLSDLAQQVPELAPFTSYFDTHVNQATANAPAEERQKAFDHIALGVMNVAQQAQAQAPSGPQVSTGQQNWVANTNRLGGPIGSPVPGTAVQQVPSPNTTVFNPQTNSPALVGVQPHIAAGPIQAGPVLGQETGASGTHQTINADWAATTAKASGAQNNIAVLENIKRFAPGAITGVAADQREFVNGLAALVGIPAADLLKTNTDELAKNSNMLALTGGDTNLAKQLAEVANPNKHMTETAIKQTADQIIGIQKTNLDRFKVLAPFKALADQGHPELYNAAAQKFNEVADPRIRQFEAMSPEERKQFKNSMSPDQQADFSKKIRAYEALPGLQK